MLPIREPTAIAGAEQPRLLEVGCGVGNALFPLLRLIPGLFLYGVDCSKNAIQCVQNHPDYSAANAAAAAAAAANAAASAGASSAAVSASSSSSVAVSSASSDRCGAWVCDVVKECLPAVLATDHLDYATLVFVLSAIHPAHMVAVLRKVHTALKTNRGVLFVRD